MYYSLKECEINGIFVDDKNFKKGKIKKNLSISNFNEVSSTFKLFSDKNKLLDQLNFQIEIDHQFLKKCCFKSENLLDSLELYNDILKLTSS